MDKKIIYVSILTSAVVLITGFSPALATPNTDLFAIRNDLVTIEVNHFLGRHPTQVYTTITAAEASEIRQYLIELSNAQQQNDREAIERYESILNQKGIFGQGYQQFNSKDDYTPWLKNTKLSHHFDGFADDNISNRFCYFGAIGEGLMLWWIGLALWQTIIKAVTNVSNPIGAIILLIMMLPFLVLSMLLSDLIPFRILAPTGMISLKNGTISSIGFNGVQRINVEAEPYEVNLSGFTGLTINIPPINEHKAFLFISGFAVQAEGRPT